MIMKPKDKVLSMGRNKGRSKSPTRVKALQTRRFAPEGSDMKPCPDLAPMITGPPVCPRMSWQQHRSGVLTLQNVTASP
jgi:hypothetical protein